MLPDIECLLKCRTLIERKLDWGESANWQTSDFENLQQRILDETGVSLSVSTLLRIWGRVKYGHLPSTTTLNTLAQFSGFENWRNFVKQHSNKKTTIEQPAESVSKKAVIRPNTWLRIALAGIVIIAIVGGSLFAFRKSKQPVNVAEYGFSSEPLTRAIPNSVVFTYDATASPSDSVHIQQSWDPMRRTWVDKNLHKHTSVYYEPGYFTAKLLIDHQIVKEHRLLIPTEGWLATLNTNNSIPVYLKPEQYMDSGVLRVPVPVIQENNIPMQPSPPLVKYFNVGNFEPVPVNDFSFSTQLKHEYPDGAAACQRSFIMLITDDAPIIVQLSIKGCVAELLVRNIDSVVTGKTADLSGFGVDFTDWATVSIATTGNNIIYSVNGKPAYTFPRPSKDVRIVGVAFAFLGTGAVKEVRLGSKENILFEELVDQ